MMDAASLKSDPFSSQWDFYQRAVRNYSVILRLLGSADDGEELFDDIPGLFVGHTDFDMCKIFLREGDSVRENSFTCDGSVITLNIEQVMEVNGGALSASISRRVPGFGTLFVYPLRTKMNVFGFLVLGRKQVADVGPLAFRELEMVCDICNRSLLFGKMFLTPNDKERTMTIDEAIMNDFPHGFLLVDRNQRISYANPRAKHEFEGAKGLLLGEYIGNIISGIDHGLLGTEKTFEGEVGFRSEEALRLFRMECYPVKRNETVYTGIILTSIADRKIRSEEEIQKHKMESIGMLAGGIAHDFNNLLTGILGYASLMKRALPEDTKFSRYVEVIESSAKRAAQLTHHLLNFARRRREAREGVNLNVLISDVLFLLKESMGEIRVEKKLDGNLPVIRGNESELQQVFLNLFVNARDAMAGEGLLKVTTGRQRQGGDEFAVIEVRDTGCGIDEEVRQKMFEPFFSTKGEGDGIGIGLYIVREIIKSHSGVIEVDSRKGKGTTFTISLPLAAAPGDRAEDAKNGRLRPKKRKVLVVDDEEIVRELLRGILVPHGFEVLEAPNGRSALELYQIHRDTIDVIILDMVMPGMKGDAVLSALTDRPEHTKVIISSGFMSEEQRERLGSFKIEAFLDKPYRDREVLQAMALLFPESQDS